MKGFLITHKGMENTAALEVKELIGKNSEVSESCIVFNIKEYEELFKLCYKAQSAIGVYYLLGKFDFNGALNALGNCQGISGKVENHGFPVSRESNGFSWDSKNSENFFREFEKNIQNINFDEWLSKKASFRVECKKKKDMGISNQEIEQKLGSILIKHIKKKCGYKQKVDLNNSDVSISVHLSGKGCCFGIDFAGFNLSKRSYNIFTYPAAIKGTIAYFLVRLSGYNGRETLMDCFSGSGTIPIEAALFASGFPANFFNKERFIFLEFSKFKSYNFKKFFEAIDCNIKDSKIDIYSIDASMKYINYAKKNSKIAGVGKKIRFRRMDAEWLDTKFEKGKVNKIVTKMPLHREAGKLYSELFYQAQYILSEKGKICLMGNKELVEKYSLKYNFRIFEEQSVFSGKQEYKVFLLEQF